MLPTSPLSARGPKYYNSAETPLFKKSEQLYGLDLARQACGAAGYLAVVEGYTDVLMAHQLGIGQVVATMGTALNARHVQQLRRFTPRVVLVFDADADLCRVGFCDGEALELLLKTAKDLNAKVHRQTGVRLCVLEIDGERIIFASTPRLRQHDLSRLHAFSGRASIFRFSIDLP